MEALSPVSPPPEPENVPVKALPALLRVSAPVYAPASRASGSVPLLRFAAFW